MKPLYGHSCAETAYLVNDYPYGRLRCEIKFWLESDVKKGVRFCSQTVNPKNGRVNAPRKSTYARWAGCMYLDEQLHVQWRGLGEYTKPEEILLFMQDFPGADYSILQNFLKLALPQMKARAEGKLRLHWTINGKEEPRTEGSLQEEREEAQKDLALLEQAAQLIKTRNDAVDAELEELFREEQEAKPKT